MTDQKNERILPKTAVGWATLTVSIGIILGSAGTLYLGLQTTAQAAEDHATMQIVNEEARAVLRSEFQQHVIDDDIKDDRTAISGFDTQITEIEYKILYEGLTEAQVVFWNSRLKTLRSDKECVRVGKCEQ